MRTNNYVFTNGEIALDHILPLDGYISSKDAFNSLFWKKVCSMFFYVNLHILYHQNNPLLIILFLKFVLSTYYYQLLCSVIHGIGEYYWYEFS